MGCTTSTVVFDGLRTVLERNCSGYICKGAAEPIGPSEAERALSRRESRALPTPRVLKVCVYVCVLTQYCAVNYIESGKTIYISIYIRAEMNSCFHDHLICYFCIKWFLVLPIKYQNISKKKKAYHKCPEPKITQLNSLFCPTVSLKPKHVPFSLIQYRKKEANFHIL